MRKNRKDSWGYLILTLALLGSFATIQAWGQPRSETEAARRARIREERSRMTPAERRADLARIERERCADWDAYLREYSRAVDALPAAEDALRRAETALSAAREAGSSDAPRLRRARNAARDRVASLRAAIRRGDRALSNPRSEPTASEAYARCSTVRSLDGGVLATLRDGLRRSEPGSVLEGEGVPAGEHHGADED